MVHQLTDVDIQMNETNDDIQTTGTDENIEMADQMTGTNETEMADPMTGTDQTTKNANDESSTSTEFQQLSARILEFQGEYSQFKSAEVKIFSLTKSNNNFK